MTDSHRLDGCTLWQHHPDAILVVGREQRGFASGQEMVVHDLNPRAQSMFGYDPTDAKGGPFERFVPSGESTQTWPTDVFRARRNDGSAFAATADMASLGQPDWLEMVVIRDVTELLVWRDELPVATTARLEQLQAREAALDESRETLAQHLFAAGLAVRQLRGITDRETHDRLEKAVSVLDEVMTDLMTRN